MKRSLPRGVDAHFALFQAQLRAFDDDFFIFAAQVERFARPHGPTPRGGRRVEVFQRVGKAFLAAPERERVEPDDQLWGAEGFGFRAT